MEWNDRRDGGGVRFFEPRPYFPHRGSEEKRAQPTQGKLFGESKPVDQHRYQRGYTPERMAEVRRMPLNIEGGGSKPQLAAATAEQVIARSTTPADSVHPHHYYLPGGPKGDNPSDNEGFSLRINLGASKRTTRSEGGSFTAPKWSSYPTRFGEINLRASRGEWNGQALLHEMGHSESYSRGTPHSSFDTPTHKGQEEAYADDNMMSRWRPDPRDVRKGISRSPNPSYESEGAFTQQRSYGGKTAHRAYLKARKTPLVKPGRIKAAEGRNRAAFYQPQMIEHHAKDYPLPEESISPYAKAEGIIHPMQFGKLG